MYLPSEHTPLGVKEAGLAAVCLQSRLRARLHLARFCLSSTFNSIEEEVPLKRPAASDRSEGSSGLILDGGAAQ